MAYLFRVTLWPLVVLLWVFSLLAALLYVSPAHAAFPASFTWYVPGFTAPESTPDIACQKARPGQFAAPSVLRTNTAAPGGTDYVCNDAGGSTVATAIRYNYPDGATCPTNASVSGATCVCSSGFEQQGSSCVVPPDPSEAHCTSILGSPVKTSWTSTAPSLSTRNVCVSGGSGYNCNATIEPDFCGTSAPGGVYLCHGSGTSAAGACTPSSSPEQPVPPTEPVSELPSPPPPGTCPGEVNGVTVNVPCSRTETKGTKTTTENDGAGNTTAKIETKTTSCTAAGSCSTTVTTTTTVNGGTATTTTKTTEESKGQFCANNPGSKECGDGDGSSFGGSCESGFKCEGDAVQCATAKAVNDNLCKLEEVFEMDSETRGLVDSVLDGTWTENPKDNPEQINVGTFNQSNPFGTSCPNDVTAQMGAFTLTIPLASMCGWLQIIGNMLVAVSLLGATLLIVRGSSS